MNDKIVFLSKKAEQEWNSPRKLEEYDESTILLWKQRAADYEWMFLEQKEICEGYREIIEGLEKEIQDLKLKK